MSELPWIGSGLDRSLSKIDQVLQFSLKEMSLDEKVGKDRDTPISDYLVDKEAEGPEEDLVKREANTLVTEAMEHLSSQEQLVLRQWLRDHDEPLVGRDNAFEATALRRHMAWLARDLVAARDRDD